jgi:hypothetical protein
MAVSKQWQVVDDGPRGEGGGRDNRRHRLHWLAQLLDSQFNFLGVRLGWDPIIGLIPGFGDLLTSLAGFYIIVEAGNLGAPPSVILRMGINLIVDNMFDTVPILGHVFDVFWRANLRNVALLERYLEQPRRTVVRSRAVVAFTLFAVVFVSFLCAAVAAYLAVVLLQWLLRQNGGWA